jgi:iron-sulfur cluster repair protein YtfE (RIC family)
MKKQDIIKIITENTEYWQPHGEKNSCFIIEEEEPFFWRINKEWASEIADKILKALEAEEYRMEKTLRVLKKVKSPAKPRSRENNVWKLVGDKIKKFKK